EEIRPYSGLCVHAFLSGAAEIPVQHVSGHALHHGVGPQQAGYPLAGSGMEDFALASPEVDDHAVGVADLFKVLVAGGTIERFSHEAAILVAEELVLQRNVGAFLDLAGHGERKNLQPVRRAACRGWIGQAVAHLVIQPIHLIAVDVAFSTQYVAVIETGAGKCPMPGAVDGKATHAARGASAPAGIDAVRCVEPEGLAAGAADLGRLPAVGCARHVAAAIDRILGAGPIFVADLLASLVLQSRLPHEIAGKTRCTAA